MREALRQPATYLAAIGFVALVGTQLYLGGSRLEPAQTKTAFRAAAAQVSQPVSFRVEERSPADKECDCIPAHAPITPLQAKLIAFALQ